MDPVSGLFLGGAAMGLFQGFLGGMAQARRNEALQGAMRQLQVQQGNLDVAFNTRTSMLEDSQRFSMEGIMQAIPVQRMALRRQYEQASGTARAAIVESGFATSGSKRAILDSIDMDAVISRRVLEQNIGRTIEQSALEYRAQLFQNQQQRMAQQYGYQNQMNTLRNEQGSTFLTGLTQGTMGFGTGISIASAFSPRTITPVTQAGQG